MKEKAARIKGHEKWVRDRDSEPVSWDYLQRKGMREIQLWERGVPFVSYCNATCGKMLQQHVAAQHNRTIGTRWLAIIHARVPQSQGHSRQTLMADRYRQFCITLAHCTDWASVKHGTSTTKTLARLTFSCYANPCTVRTSISSEHFSMIHSSNYLHSSVCPLRV